ncbi:carboxylesterase/lipase family protein [Microbacterium sp. 179-I 1D1 NHS]|uniref:carboxylesterase/lipase family protein n=1 Tax=Microbacterium sp. 179-I 1D1 NHS TaxID=3374298 RepID=UPI00387921AF
MPHPAPHVTLTTGTIAGAATGGIRRFLGIRYAEPPFGERRFATPVPAAPWQGVREATRFGPTAPQSPYQGESATLLSSVEIPGDDILTVNVWAPEDAVGLPVVVWVHGGALERGTAALEGYDGTTFARDGIVFVSVNYRLGAEGFSILDGAPRNLGLLDVVTAVEWVFREIHAFGGDAGRVTLMGESAGGALVAAAMTLPRIGDRAYGAIIQSGPLDASSPERSGRVTRAVAKHLGIPATRDAFAAVSPQELVDARLELARNSSPLSGASFALALDPATLPRPIDAALADVAAPILIGTNTDEYRLWLSPSAIAALGPLKVASLALAMRVPFRAVRAARAAGFPGGEALGQAVGDKILRAPATRLAHARPNCTFVYEFAWQSPVRDLRAAHAVEIAFAFGRLDGPDALALSGADAPQSLADEMHRTWVSFITTGDPGWPSFGPSRTTRIFDTESRTTPQRRTEVVDALR